MGVFSGMHCPIKTAYQMAQGDAGIVPGQCWLASMLNLFAGTAVGLLSYRHHSRCWVIRGMVRTACIPEILLEADGQKGSLKDFA